MNDKPSLRVLLMFCPSDGKCYWCGKNIFEKIDKDTLKEQVTACPHCKRTFVD